MVVQQKKTALEGMQVPSAALEAKYAVVSLGGHRVLDRVSVRVNSGEVLGIVGPNGSGKTTLLRAMARLVGVEQGEVLMNGTDLTDTSAQQRARDIAYMPQSAGNHSFTALEFVLMGRYPHLGRFKLESRSDIEIAEAAMRRTGTSEFAHRRLQTLSGGERQRVLLARVLAQQAEVLLLDEPTASLDMQHQLLTMETARTEASNGAAVAVVLHDLSLAARYCDRLVLMNKGTVVGDGAPWDVISQSTLRDVFAVDAAVEPDPIAGRPLVSLLGTATGKSPMATDRMSSVHIICGAGSGRDLMHRLTVAGHRVTACVLGEGDADRQTADRLRIEHVPSSPFSVISLEQDAAHRQLVRNADVTVVCEMAIGPGNLRNLEAAAEAKRLLLIERPKDARWDYTESYATRVYDELLERGEVVTREGLLAAVASAT